MNQLRLSFVLLGILALAACSGNVEGGGNGGSGGSGQGASGGQGGQGGSGGSGGTGVGGGGSGSVQCTGTTPTFPTFDKTCTTAADCVTKLHMVNCCGSMTAIGINATESAAFDAAEMTCQSQYPGCGCAAMPTTTEDGKTSMDDTLIQVDCLSGKCSTYLP
jgi:hypothetical protein